ncbi:anti-sigma factor [Micromonospora sp. NPDC023956]|uniref:anti-sigma factor n=1 Tax=Micromonospora sp. NPDC023956 TaxID=3155722 RepID=UPI003404A4C4
MQHLAHDRLVFLALGESEADTGENHHLDGCVHCRDELATLRHVAGLGTETQTLRNLPEPPAHVWDAIAAEVAATRSLPSLPEARRQRQSAENAAGPAARPGRRGVSRWLLGAVTATAAALLGVVGTLAVVRPDAPEPAPQVLVSGSLAAYGATPPQAAGNARVFADGRLHLHVTNLPEVPGYYQVWLIDPRTMEMLSVGVLGGGADALLPLPPGVDLDRYSVVDVSAEQYDNNTAHSGDSLLRGALTG